MNDDEAQKILDAMRRLTGVSELAPGEAIVHMTSFKGEPITLRLRLTAEPKIDIEGGRPHYTTNASDGFERLSDRKVVLEGYLFP